MTEQEDPKPAATSDCERFTGILERALSDEEDLGDEDLSFVRGHAAACPECGPFHAAVEEMKRLDAAPEGLAHSVAASYLARRQRRRVAWIAALPVAAAVAIVFAVAFQGNRADIERRSPASAAVEKMAFRVVEGMPLGNGSRLLPGDAVPEGMNVNTHEGTARIQSKQLVVFGIGQAAEIQMTRLERQDVMLELGQGRMAAEVDPDAAISFGVQAGDYRITVTGTVFSVERQGSDVHVDVLRGSVRVESQALGLPPVSVGAGKGFSSSSRSLSDLSPETRAQVLALLGHSAGVSNPAASAAAALTPLAASAIVPNGQVIPSTRAANEKQRAVPEAPLTQPGEIIAQPVTDSDVASNVPATGVAAATASEWIRSARECRKQQDWACAAASYNSVIERFPGTPEAATVLLPLAEIELEHLHQPAKALEHYSAYCDKVPDGPLAQEALYGRCRALAATGDLKRETEALIQFLARYPESAYAPNARSRLDKIVGQK